MAKKQEENFVLEYQNEFQNDISCTDPLLSIKLHTGKRWDFHLETHLDFFCYVKSCEKVKRDKLFEILQR
jgi:hypothetical protein